MRVRNLYDKAAKLPAWLYWAFMAVIAVYIAFIIALIAVTAVVAVALYIPYVIIMMATQDLPLFLFSFSAKSTYLILQWIKNPSYLGEKVGLGKAITFIIACISIPAALLLGAAFATIATASFVWFCVGRSVTSPISALSDTWQYWTRRDASRSAYTIMINYAIRPFMFTLALLTSVTAYSLIAAFGLPALIAWLSPMLPAALVPVAGVIASTITATLQSAIAIVPTIGLIPVITAPLFLLGAAIANVLEEIRAIHRNASPEKIRFFTDLKDNQKGHVALTVGEFSHFTSPTSHANEESEGLYYIDNDGEIYRLIPSERQSDFRDRFVLPKMPYDRLRDLLLLEPSDRLRALAEDASSFTVPVHQTWHSIYQKRTDPKQAEAERDRASVAAALQRGLHGRLSAKPPVELADESIRESPSPVTQ